MPRSRRSTRTWIRRRFPPSCFCWGWSISRRGIVAWISRLAAAGVSIDSMMIGDRPTPSASTPSVGCVWMPGPHAPPRPDSIRSGSRRHVRRDHGGRRGVADDRRPFRRRARSRRGRGGARRRDSRPRSGGSSPPGTSPCIWPPVDRFPRRRSPARSRRVRPGVGGPTPQASRVCSSTPRSGWRSGTGWSPAIRRPR